MNRFQNKLIEAVNSDAGKLVILYLLQAGTATVEQLADKFDWQLSKTYSICSTLYKKDVLTKLKHSNERYALKRVSF
jgi:DNA-binding IclR family transcriptional regulator